MSLKLLAIDLGKRSFHCHGIDSDGVIVSRKVSRGKLLQTIGELEPMIIAMEACAALTIGVDIFSPMAAKFC